MSDVMLLGVLRMPMDYPLNVITFTQIVSRCREAADRIEADKKFRQSVWDIVGECMTGIDDSEKVLQIEKLLLDSER